MGDQPDIGQLGDAVYEDDIGRLDVAMDELLRVEVTQRFAQFDREMETFPCGQPTPGVELVRERPGGVAGGVDVPPAVNAICQLHHVVEESGGVVAAHVQDGNQAVMGSGDGRVLQDAPVFALERAAVGEGVFVDELHGVMDADFAASQPDFPVSALADGADQFVVGNADTAFCQGGLRFAGNGRIDRNSVIDCLVATAAGEASDESAEVT